ncbi:DUF1376 domain-containing protein [Mesorhizobium sp. M0152]|uniref:DUF1376 domain-containing protein n=1 Tax=Mesorhizobium sp. M0152 TaxID=2956898 RepID=UPI00333C8268
MKAGLEWYKHEPRAFLDGVQGLGPDVIGAYIVLLDLIYARGGETKRDDRHLSGILGCSIRMATSLTDKLIDLGKLSFEGDLITNSRAKSDTKSARNGYETRSKSQRERRENEATSNKINDLGDKQETSALNREDKNRIEKEPNGSKSGEPLPLFDPETLPPEPTEETKPAAPPKPTARQILQSTLRRETADAVVKHRVKIRKPLTDRAAELLAEKFGRCEDPDAAADMMIANGWQGFEPAWVEGRQRQANTPTTIPRRTTAGVLADMARDYGETNNEPLQIESRRDW